MPVIAFDVNETLLDLSVLDEHFGSEALRRRWFAQMLQLGFVSGLTGRYVDFGTAQRAALEMLGTEVDAGVVDAMRSLPPHPDAAPALDRRRGGGLDDRVDAILAADHVKGGKPRPEPDALVARTFGGDVGSDLEEVAGQILTRAGSAPPASGRSPSA